MNKIYKLSFSTSSVLMAFFIGSQLFAQVPNCATALSPLNGATLTRMSTFSWTAPTGPASTGYKFYLGTSPAATELVNGTITIAAPTVSYNYTFAANAGGLIPGITYYWKIVPTNMVGDAVGCASQSFTITAAGDPTVYPVGSWNAYCFNSTNFTSYVGYYTATGVNFDSRTSWTSSNQSPSNTVATGGATSYLGGAMPVDNHTISYKRKGFTPGTYTIDVLYDDECFVYVNNALVYTFNGFTSTYKTSVATIVLDANSLFEFRWREGGGGSNGSVNFNIGATAPTLIAGTIAGNQFMCVGDNPVIFTSTVASTGSCGTVTSYQWQQDPGCTGAWSDISGASFATYDAPAGIAQTTCYRRMVSDPACNRTAVSNTTTVTLYSGQQGNPATFPLNTWNGYVYDFAVVGFGGGANTGWTDYKGFYTYAGVSASDPSFNTSAFYTSANLPTSAPGYLGCQLAGTTLNGVQLKRQGFPVGTYQLNFQSDDAGYLFINGALIYGNINSSGPTLQWTGNLDASSTIEFRYKNNTGAGLGSLTFTAISAPALIAGTITGTQSLCNGNTDPAAFASSLVASGTCSAVSYQWQNDVGCTGTFADISGATLPTYDAPAGVSSSTCYRRMVVDANCARSLASNTVTVTVYATAPGNPATFPLNTWSGYVYDFSVVNGGVYTSADVNWTDYKGYFTYAGVSASDPSFSTTSIYTVANVPSSTVGYFGCTVGGNLSGLQMKRQGFPVGTYSLNFNCDDAGYLYLNGVLIFSRTTPSSVANIWTGNLDASSTVEFRYKNNTSIATGALTFNLIPTPTLVAGTINGDQTLCSGNDPYIFGNTILPSGGCGTLVYQWESSIDGTTYTPISGAITTTYDVPAGLTQTTYYRRLVTDANCVRSAYSNVATVTITTVQQGNPAVFPLNTWNGYVYDFTTPGYTTTDNNWSDYRGFYSYPGVSASDPSYNTFTFFRIGNVPSSVSTYAGCQVTQTNGSLCGAQIKRQGFPTGTYQIDFNSDDAGFLYVNGTLVYSRPANGTQTNAWTGTLNAGSTIDCRYKNNGGTGSSALAFSVITPTLPLSEGAIAISGPSKICPSDVPPTIVSTVNATSTCYIYYQWQSSPDAITYSNIPGATTSAYTPLSILANTYFQRVASDGCGDIAISNNVLIQIGPSAVVDTAAFISTSNQWTAYVYNQQNFVAASLFGSYTDMGASTTDPSFNSATLWATTSAPSLAPTYTGCQVGDDNHSVIYKRKGFTPATYSLSVINDDGCTLWINGKQVYSRGIWTPTFINGVWVGNLSASSIVEFRWTEGVGGSQGGVTFVVVPTPTPLVGGTIANATTTICSGNIPNAFTSSAAPSGGCFLNAFQWQLSPDGITYSDITGATASTYAPGVITATTYYQRKAFDACSANALSNVVTITIGVPTPPNPSIFGSNVWNVYAYNDVAYTQLMGSYVDNGFSVTDPSFDSRNKWGVNASPSSAAGYQGCFTNLDQHGVIYKRHGFPAGMYRLDYNSDDAGQVYINGTLVYTSVSWGTLVTNIWTGTLNATSTIEYRWADTGGGASYGILPMTYPVVTTPLLGGTIATTVSTVCSGNVPAPFTSTANASGGCYSSYQWQSSADGTTYAAISGATTSTYSPATGISVNTYFRRSVTDVCGATVYSNVILITVGTPSTPVLSFGTGGWNAYVYNARNSFIPANLVGSYVEPNTSGVNYTFDTQNSWNRSLRASIAAGYSGCQVGNNTFGVSFRQTNFTPGTYQIDIDADDDAVLIINGVTIFTTINAAGPQINVWTGTLNASSQVEIKYGENNGNANCKVTLTSTIPASLVQGSIGTDQTICSNVVPAALTSVTDATSGCTITYQWQQSTTSASGPWTNIGGNTKTLTLNPPGSSYTQTTYYIRNASDACGRSGTSTNVVTVTVNPRPGNAGALTGLKAVCANQSGVAYSLAVVSNSTSYTWVLPAGATITSGAGTNSIVVTFGSTSGSVTVQPVNACGTGLTSTTAVTVTPTIPANPGTISGLSSVCSGQFSVSYSVPAQADATSYIWVIPAGATILSGVNTNAISVTWGSTAGNITVNAVNGCGNSTVASSLPVSIMPTPSAANAVMGTGSVCPNQTGVIFSTIAAANATSYSWSIPSDATITAGAGTTSITVTFGVTTGNVSVTPVNLCGNGAPKSLLVTVKSMGVASTISGPNPVCQNTTGLVYSLPAVTGATAYAWTIPTGATITAGLGTRVITVTMGTTSGSFAVTPSNSCATGTPATFAVTVTNAQPGAAGPITGINNPCTASTGITYNITSVAGATNYNWTVPSGSIIASGAGTNTVTVTFGTTSGAISVTPTNVCGSGANSSLVVALKPFPSAVGAITGPTSVCKETGVSYSISSVANAGTYTWSVPAGAVITSGAGTISIVVSYTGASVSSGTVSVIAGNTCSTTSNGVTVSINSSCSDTWTGSTTNDWNTSSNWNLGIIPSITDDVIIPSSVSSGRMPTISSSVNSRSLTNNGTIIFTTAGTLNTYGSISNTGTINTVAGSTVVFKGSSAQTITGVSTLHNVQIANTSGGVSLLSGISIRGSLTLTSGVLTTNSNLTINFDNGGNIAYNVSDAGSISGAVTGRRDVIARTHYISAPFAGATSAQVQATTPLFVNTYWKMYTKTFATQGWAAVIDITTAMPLGTGFSLAMPAAAPLMLTGTYNHNSSFVSPSYSNVAAGKYILVGNPYPSSIDWSTIFAGTGGNAVNTGGAVYYWNAANNQVASWISATGGTNGGTQFIPAMQSFMVATTGTGGPTSSVSINNTARVSNNPSYFRTTQSDNSILKLAVKTADGIIDETLISLNGDATEDFDYDKDAYKILNSAFTPSLYTTTHAGPTMYSINSLPFNESHTIPLNLKVNKDGTYELRCSELTNQTGYKILLEDKLNNVILPVDTALVYTISAKTTDNVNRFVLRFRIDLTASISLGTSKSILLSTYDKDLMVTSSGVTAEGVEMKVYDAAGRLVQILTNQSIVPGLKIIPLEKLSAGVYLVNFIIDGVSYTGKVVLK